MFESIAQLIKNPYIASGLVLLTIGLTIKVSYKYTQKPLRVTLILVGVLMVVFRTYPGTEINTEGFAIVTTLLIPVFVVLILMVLLLDALMAKVMQQESQGLARYQVASRLNLVVVFIMVVEWLPYFLVM